MRVGLRVGRGVGAFLFFLSAGLGFGGDSVFFVASCGARAVLSTLVSAVAVAVRGLLLFVVGFLVGVRAAGLGRVVVRLCSGGARVRGRRGCGRVRVSLLLRCRSPVLLSRRVGLRRGVPGS